MFVRERKFGSSIGENSLSRRLRYWALMVVEPDIKGTQVNGFHDPPSGKLMLSVQASCRRLPVPLGRPRRSILSNAHPRA